MPFELSQAEGHFLVHLARNTVTTYLETGERIGVPPATPQNLRQKCGVFVTLNTMRGAEKRLRGCIGYPEPLFPLVEATITSAINASTQDPRFVPVSKNELTAIVIEVSVLTPPELLVVSNPKDYVNGVKVGKDGLIVARGGYKGLLLPQVPVEWNWDAETFLAQSCMKAGLSPDAWLLEGTTISTFSCVIAREVLPHGDVEVIDMRKGQRP